MLTSEGCKARRDRLWKALPSACEALVVADPSHLIYFADFDPSPFVFRSVESGGILLLTPGRASLVADDMLGPFVEAAKVDHRVTPTWYDGAHSAPNRRSLLVASALQQLATIPGSRIGIELGSVPSGVVEGLRAARPDAQILDLTPIIRPLKRSKDADEIAALRRAIHAGEAAHAALLADVRPGMTELDAYLLAQNAAVGYLGEPAILYGDFASGPRTEVEKGGSPSSRVIAEGDLLLADFSVIRGGYRGDFTNTFAVGGGPTPEQVRLFDACLAAMKAGELLLRAGTPARAVDAAVRGHFASLGLDRHFPHHTGHGIGLGHPEPPYLVPESDDVLVAGDVVTIEPGLYVEGVGGMRIERNYLVTSDGFETLSKHEIRLDQPR